MATGMIVQFRLKSKFSEYGKIPTCSLIGKEVAEKMPDDNGIYNVNAVSAPGFLSKHYTPSKKTVNPGAHVSKVKIFLQPQN